LQLRRREMEVKMVCLSFQRLTGRKKDIAHSHEPLEKKKKKKKKKRCFKITEVGVGPQLFGRSH
jgi:hypothetical protein